MFVVLCAYEVKPESQERFERVYGPTGDWVSLFRRDAHYLRTALLRDLTRPHVYLTADYWHSRKAYGAFLHAGQAEYKRLDAECQDLTLRERRIGSYEEIGS
jgi:heme-degrading monooxygenase HmoA